MMEGIMKKTIFVLGLVAGLGLTGLQAVCANPGNGGPEMAGGFGPPGMAMQQKPDEATLVKIRTFMTENKALRREMAIRMVVQKAIMMSKTPDTAVMAKVAGEQFDLRQAMMDKAKAAGLAAYIGPDGMIAPGGPDRGAAPPRMDAGPGQGMMAQRGGGGPGQEMMAQRGGGVPGLSPEDKAQGEKFHQENRDLERQIMVKMSVKDAMMHSEKIDYKALATVAGELFDLHEEMRQKAMASGVK